MKKFLILIALFGFNSCENSSTQNNKTQPGSVVEYYKSRNAGIVYDVCKNLDRKQERDGVYKTSKDECVVIADYMVKEGEKCKGEIQCEVESMREARMRRVIDETRQDLAGLELLERIPTCHGLKGGESSRLIYTKDQGYCILKISKEAIQARIEKSKAEFEEWKKENPIKRDPAQKPIPGEPY